MVRSGFVTIVFRRQEVAGTVQNEPDVVQKDTRNVPEAVVPEVVCHSKGVNISMAD